MSDRELPTPFTEAEHRQWRRERANQQQRQRREKYRRIDYYVSKEAAAIIDAETFPAVGGSENWSLQSP